MKKSIKKLLSMFLIINICLVTTINTFAIDYQEPRIIKVGYTDYYNFINKDNDDKMYGYAVDYLQEISKHTNFRFEYVYMDWNSLIEALKNKKIDLICSAEKTAQRNEHFEFSQFPIITQQYILYTTTENKFYYNDFESFNNKTIGVLKNSVIDDRLNNYALKNNFEFTPKYFNTISEIQNSLQSNEIDFAAMTDTSPFQSFKNVGIYGVSQNYMMTYKDNDFMDDINKAVEEIKTEIYDFDWSLRQKYYSKVNTSTTFTKEENKYIENIEKINVGLISNNAPFTKENKDGKITGIYKDVFDLISDASGIEFNFKIISDSKTPSEILSKEDIDIFMGVSENYLSNYLKIKLRKGMFSSGGEEVSEIWIDETKTFNSDLGLYEIEVKSD
ncbi:MAG: transporter substrate-binding domain-containing protein, partial [Clostridia bacterium]